MHSFVNIMNSRYSYSTRSIKNNHFYLWNDDYLCLRYAWNNLDKCSHRFRIRRDSSRMKRLTLGIEKHNLMNDWNRTMFLCFNFADFWVWSVVLWFFSYTNSLGFVSLRSHCIWIILEYVRSVNINESFID